MPLRLRLFKADLHYRSGLTLHTAASGAVDRLTELYLLFEDRGCFGIGEVRANAAYLNGFAPEEVLADVKCAIMAAPLEAGPEILLATEAEWAAGRSAAARMLLDMALRDFVARHQGLSVAECIAARAVLLGARTNQTLFWSATEEFKARAADYVRRGFRELKVRIGIGSFDHDVERLAWLRSAFGDDIEIAADVNGAWTLDQATARLQKLAKLGLTYVEQPIAAGEWAGIERLSESSPLPVMLDESLTSLTDVERVCQIGGKLEAHLKLLKLGGIGPAASAAVMLAKAGIPIMVGQMNEGAAATAAALHLAVAVSASRAELYGADGLADDPVEGVEYADGEVRIAGREGLGVTFNPRKAQQIMEIER